MSHQPLTPSGFRIRFVVVAAIVGIVLGGFVGVRWVTRNDPPPIQQIFVHEYLLARGEQMLGIRPLGGVLQPSQHVASWMQQFSVTSQMSYWHERFAGRIALIECFVLSGAITFALLALRLTRRRIDPYHRSDARRIRRDVNRPWD
jgi:hypothetical protein